MDQHYAMWMKMMDDWISAAHQIASVQEKNFVSCKDRAKACCPQSFTNLPGWCNFFGCRSPKKDP
jgi:hypothetical protein